MAIRLSQTDAVIYEMPKTGTTWVRKALERAGVEHETEPTTDGNCCPRHSPWFCFPPAKHRVCVVRYPTSWYQSYFQYHCFGSLVDCVGNDCVGKPVDEVSPVLFHPDKWYAHQMFHHCQGGVDFTFEQWVDRLTSFFPAAYTRMVDAYFGPMDYPVIDTVMRTETLAADLCNLLVDLGYEFNRSDVEQTAPVNVSKGDVRWRGDQRRAVLMIEQAVIRRFYA